jgi:hypothetical protein
LAHPKTLLVWVLGVYSCQKFIPQDQSSTFRDKIAANDSSLPLPLGKRIIDVGKAKKPTEFADNFFGPIFPSIERGLFKKAINVMLTLKPKLRFGAERFKAVAGLRRNEENWKHGFPLAP